MRNVNLAIKSFADPLVVTFSSTGEVSGTLGDLTVSAVDTVGTVSGEPRFVVEGMPDMIGGMPVLNDVESGGEKFHLVPDGEGVGFAVSGKKWIFAKAATIKYEKNAETEQPELSVVAGKGAGDPNLCGLKLTVNAKTGVFKGGFCVYVKSGSDAKPKVKKIKFKVSGVLVDGAGAGIATAKGASAAVVLR